MKQDGFTLLGLLIVVVIVILLALGGGIYFNVSVDEAATPIETGISAMEQAEQLKGIIEQRDQEMINVMPEPY